MTKLFNPYGPHEICTHEEWPIQKPQLNIDQILVWFYRFFMFLLVLSTYILFFYFKYPEYAASVGFITIVGGLLDIFVSLVVMEINKVRSRVDNAITRNSEQLSSLYERTRRD